MTYLPRKKHSRMNLSQDRFLRLSASAWLFQATASAGIGEFPARVKFVLTLGSQTVVAVERAAMEELLERSHGSTSVRRANLLCAVGRDAGSAACAATARATVEGADERLLAMVSEGRSTVVAVRPQGARSVLEALHDVFFPSSQSKR